jgi:hypothetical protein
VEAVDMSTASGAQPRVTVIVLNCNGMAVIRECIASLKQSTHVPLHICVSDNASTDGSPEWVAANHPDVHVIRNRENLGWSGANNVGIRYALEQGADYVWILNNDVEVEPDCIAEQIAMAETQHLDIVGPLIFYFEPKDKVWFAGGITDLKRGETDHVQTVEAFRALPQEQRFISGCALMVHRRVFERIGVIDERFFIYYEDTDFCLRAARAGFRMDVAEKARMYHKVSAFSGGTAQRSAWKSYYTLRSGLLFYRKHLGWWAFHRRYCHGHLAKWMNALGDESRTDEGRAYAKAVVDGLWYVIAGLYEPRGHPECPAWFRSWTLRRPWLVAQLMALRLS